RTIEHWFDDAAFKIPGCPNSQPVCPNPANVGRFGNSGLYILEGPGVADLDFSLMKHFNLWENRRLQFRLIMVNALNHPNFAVPRSNIKSLGTVGTISSMARVLNGLQATALVNEAYLRLIDTTAIPWQNRAHFFAVSAQVMRRILVDLARSRRRYKRGGEQHAVSLEEAAAVSTAKSADIIAVDEALN